MSFKSILSRYCAAVSEVKGRDPKHLVTELTPSRGGGVLDKRPVNGDFLTCPSLPLYLSIKDPGEMDKRTWSYSRSVWVPIKFYMDPFPGCCGAAILYWIRGDAADGDKRIVLLSEALIEECARATKRSLLVYTHRTADGFQDARVDIGAWKAPVTWGNARYFGSKIGGETTPLFLVHKDTTAKGALTLEGVIKDLGLLKSKQPRNALGQFTSYPTAS